MRDGYQDQGLQQARKLSNAQAMLSETATNCSNPTDPCGQWGLEWMQCKHSDEYQLEGKSGASSRGNSSSMGVH